MKMEKVKIDDIMFVIEYLYENKETFSKKIQQNKEACTLFMMFVDSIMKGKRIKKNENKL